VSVFVFLEQWSKDISCITLLTIAPAEVAHCGAEMVGIPAIYITLMMA
jgi:hypothetical protein